MPVNPLHYRLIFERLLQHTRETLSFCWRCTCIIAIIIGLREQAVHHKQRGYSYINNSKSSSSVTVVSVSMDTPTTPTAPSARAPGLQAPPSAASVTSAAGLTSQVSASSNLTQKTSVTTVTSMYSVTSRRQLYQVTNQFHYRSDYYEANNMLTPTSSIIKMFKLFYINVSIFMNLAWELLDCWKLKHH